VAENFLNMKILITASEATPFITTGGLGEVTGTLSDELKNNGIDSALILPYYRKIKKNAGAFNIKPTGRKVRVPLGDRLETGEIWEGRTRRNATVYFIGNDKFYDRDEIYGTSSGDFPDNASRFIFYNRAVCEIVKLLGFKFDVIHCHDWQAALIPVYLKTIYKNDFPETATIMTIHNLGYQGLFGSFDMPLTGLGWKLFNMEGLEFHGKINLLKGGILFADLINTVSVNYAKEILTHEYGFGLDAVLRKRSKDLYGIINGIDYDEWDPMHDSLIPATYSINDLSGKARCKRFLQKVSGLYSNNSENSMLAGLVTRLSSQKGVDLIAEAMEEIVRLGVKMVILGKGDESFQKTFLSLKQKYTNSISVTIDFDNTLAHKIYAGADVFLMPSRYEPCGIGQLIAQRYGTIPIGRKTGGLVDTIAEFDPSNKGRGTGFLFDEFSSKALINALKGAKEIFNNAEQWQRIQKNAMSQDFSWRRSIEEYLSLYKKAMEKKEGNKYA